MQKETDKVEEFLDNIKSYIDTKTTTTRGTTITLKQSAYTDPDKYREILNASKEVHAVATMAPPGFLIPLTTNNENATTLMYLHESQIEDGGPQPRFEICPDDPETVSLFNSIKEKGQLDPIHVFPSPTTLGKYRIYEGHRRRMVIFNMLRRDTISAVSKKCTELEAFENAFILNYERKTLNAYEMGAYITALQQRFPEVYAKAKWHHSFQETIGERLGISQSLVSRILTAYAEIEKQKGHIIPEFMTGVINLPQRTVENISKAPEELKPAIFQAVVEKNLSISQTKRLVEETVAEPEPDASTVEEKAQAFIDEGEKIQRKSDRLLDKLLNECRVKPPEAFVKDLYGRIFDEKITVEKANNFASVFFAVAYELLRKDGKLDFVFAEAARC